MLGTSCLPSARSDSVGSAGLPGVADVDDVSLALCASIRGYTWLMTCCPTRESRRIAMLGRSALPTYSTKYRNIARLATLLYVATFEVISGTVDPTRTATLSWKAKVNMNSPSAQRI